MKRNNRTKQDINIDLLEVYSELLKNKFLIILASLLFMIIGYVYALLQPKIYKVTILIREAPTYLFDAYSFYSPGTAKAGLSKGALISENYNNEFMLLLSLPDTFGRFIEQNNKIDEFKLYLKDKNINSEKFFKHEFENIKSGLGSKSNFESTIALKYSLTFKEYLPEDNFFSDFVIFSKLEAEKTLIKQISKKITNEIDAHIENLEIAKKINLEEPNIAAFSDDTFLLYNRGTKVLNYQIKSLSELLIKTQKLKLDYNPILQKGSHTMVLEPSLKFATFGFLLGLFFSILIIFFRFLLLKSY
jgi:LPS O-antigen subunit length determinant protein (WzzB/FepE family)